MLAPGQGCVVWTCVVLKTLADTLGLGIINTIGAKMSLSLGGGGGSFNSLDQAGQTLGWSELQQLWRPGSSLQAVEKQHQLQAINLMIDT